MVGASDSIFFALDFATDSIFRYRRELEALSAQGLRIWVVVHDILPISHPHWFTAASCVKYRRWMRVCARLADGFICVSNDVSEQLYTLLQQRFGLSELPAIVTIDPGSDISDVSLPVDGSQLPKASGLTPEKFAQSAIVVGTLEPRKGHADVLDAFELIWSGQILPGTAEIPLILIGKQGWNTKALTDRIRAHPQAGILLFWFDAVNDVGLRSAYDACRLVIVPSHAEGYGLPLDEALSMGVPVLARDIPVFRRHDGHQIMRFSAESSATELARAIVACHSKDRQSYPQLAVTHWDKTACQVVRALGIKSSDTNVH
jgi:glycosyltransferase involved in cell wall biosynthesis